MPHYEGKERQALQLICYQWKLEGKSLRDISALVGVSAATVYRYIKNIANDATTQAALAEVERRKGDDPLTVADEIVYQEDMLEPTNIVPSGRQEGQKTDVPLDQDTKIQLTLELSRLDSYLEAINHKVKKGDLNAIRVALSIQDRRAKYLGLDRPQRFDFNAHVMQESTTDIEIKSLVQELEARNQAETEQRAGEENA